MQQSHGIAPSRNTSITKIVDHLKGCNEDFEWYPTTDEIIQCISHDVTTYAHEYSLGLGKRFQDIPNARRCGNFSLLDCGAGDGRVLDALTTGKKYAIEKSVELVHQQSKYVYIVGTEFLEQTLLDKNVDVIFSNPPYSSYEEWAVKILSEACSELVYLVIPKRWSKSLEIQKVIDRRSIHHEVILETDFHDAPRKARAEVEVIRFDLGSNSSLESTFSQWFEDEFNLGGTAKATTRSAHLAEVDRHHQKTLSDKVNNELVAGSDFASALEELYQAEMRSITESYKKICGIDFSLLQELGVKRNKVLEGMRLKIKSLKNKYWHEYINRVDSIVSRLTMKSREVVTNRFFEHVNVDYSTRNAYALTHWLIKHASEYFDSQLIDTYVKLIDDANVILYKSNQKTFKFEHWRFAGKEASANSTHFSLDYRVVLHRSGGLYTGDYRHSDTYNGLSKTAYIVLCDLMTVADNLGFSTKHSSRPDAYSWSSGKKVELWCRDRLNQKDKVLMEVKAFKNGNLHIKFDQDFIRALNVEFGRLMGWLRSKEEASNELNLTPEQAAECFKSNFQILPEMVLPLLGVES